MCGGNGKVMDFTKLFGGMAVILVGTIAFFGLITEWNGFYGSDLGSEVNYTRVQVENLLNKNLNISAGSIGNSTLPDQGAGESNLEQGLIRRSLRVFTKLDDLLGLVPALMNDGALALGVPQQYVDIASWVFIISLGLTLATVFLLGIRRISN